MAVLTQVAPQSVWPVAQPQRPIVQTCVGGHMVPVPHDGPPGHTLGMSVPQATVLGEVVGQRGAHSHRLVVVLQR